MDVGLKVEGELCAEECCRFRCCQSGSYGGVTSKLSLREWKSYLHQDKVALPVFADSVGVCFAEAINSSFAKRKSY